MSAAKPMTTHERAEKMVAERLGFRIYQQEIVSTDDTHLMWMRVGQYMGFAGPEEVELWLEAVRLQAEIMEQEGK